MLALGRDSMMNERCVQFMNCCTVKYGLLERGRSWAIVQHKMCFPATLAHKKQILLNCKRDKITRTGQKEHFNIFACSIQTWLPMNANVMPLMMLRQQLAVHNDIIRWGCQCCFCSKKNKYSMHPFQGCVWVCVRGKFAICLWFLVFTLDVKEAL